jgi:hypothetical protein
MAEGKEIYNSDSHVPIEVPVMQGKPISSNASTRTIAPDSGNEGGKCDDEERVLVR